MRSLICAAVGILSMWGSAFAATNLAVCGPVSGQAYYHNAQILPKKNSGWTKDAITSGKVTLVQLSETEFDILFIDAKESITSHRNDGAKILLLRKGAHDMTFLVIYSGMVIEMYTFFKNNDGQAEYVVMQSKGGDGMIIHKSAVMTGKCSELTIPK